MGLLVTFIVALPALGNADDTKKCGDRVVGSHDQQVVDTAVDVALGELKKVLPSHCNPEHCSPEDLNRAAVAGLEEAAAHLALNTPASSPSKARAYVMLGGGVVIYTGVMYLIAKFIPGDAESKTLMFLWGFLGLDQLRSAASVELEQLTAAIRQGIWHVRNGFRAVDPNTETPKSLLLGRYQNNQSRIGSQEGAGRGINNNADVAATLRWIPAHQALVNYLKTKHPLDKKSLVSIFANAVKPLWINYSLDFLPTDPVLTAGARTLLADFAQSEGLDLLPFIGEDVMRELAPTPDQEDFFRNFVMASLKPTKAVGADSGIVSFTLPRTGTDGP